MEIAPLFNRALAHSFEKKRSLFLAAMLVISGLLIVLGRSFALYTQGFGDLTLLFVSIFIIFGMLLSASIVVIRLYCHKVKNQTCAFRSTFLDSLEGMLKASYFALPLLLAYLIVWVLLGIFLLLKEIPMVGSFFSVIFAFAPFILIFGAICLLFTAFFALFFFAPPLALQPTLGMKAIFRSTIHQIGSNFSANLLLAVIALILPAILFGLLWISACWAFRLYAIGPSYPLEQTIQEIVIMIPFVVLLTPAINFFFNFATEAFLLLEPEGTEKKQD